jgi:hypothetical protein
MVTDIDLTSFHLLSIKAKIKTIIYKIVISLEQCCFLLCDIVQFGKSLPTLLMKILPPSS